MEKLEGTEIRPAVLPDDLPAITALFLEYRDSLGVDLCFQEFDSELATLPGSYAPPQGCILLAWGTGEPAGCVAMRPLGGDACEMKRLYVRAGSRGRQLGRRLAECICGEASRAGYSRIYLDTLPSMSAAISLYRGLGFRAVGPYTFNPVPGALFMARDL
jgi:ribosomal protein S18 acetylase RimI-like enzyme